MNDLLDEWMIDGSRWDLPFNFRVRLFHDGDVRPEDFDCYSEEDIAAWKRDEWHFVTVEVTPEDDFGFWEQASEILGGVDWGTMPSVTIGRDSLTTYPIEELAREASEKVTKICQEVGDRAA